MRCTHCGFSFEPVVQFQHKLLCGDSTVPDQVNRLLSGLHVDLCLTDPPYGVDENYDGPKQDTRENLAVLIEGFLPLARLVADVVLLTPGNSCQRLYPESDWMLAWFVPSGTGRNPWGFSCWQPILAYGPNPYLARGKGSRPDAFVMVESADNKLGHPCSKPIKVWMWIMEAGSAEPDDVVFDPFLGSGTTLIAAHNLGRRAFGIELSPNYCAVVLQRMQDAFGLEGERL